MPVMTSPIHYMERTRNYYLALGYDNPYRWAHHSKVPFSPLKKPLAECMVGIVTTAAPYQPNSGDQGPGAPYNGKAKFFEVYRAPTDKDPDLRISHIAIDRDNTSATDINSYFPLQALMRAKNTRRIAAVAPSFYGLPTDRSQNKTVEKYCRELLALSLDDKLDAVLFAPNCPVCHQSVTLAARVLEEAGIATVVMGCALDIVEHAGAPRFLFSDFPLGNACGKPHDVTSQDDTLEKALSVLEQATSAGTTIHSDQRWDTNDEWKQYYSNPDLLSEAELAKRRIAFDAAKLHAHNSDIR